MITWQAFVIGIALLILVERIFVALINLLISVLERFAPVCPECGSKDTFTLVGERRYCGVCDADWIPVDRFPGSL